MVLEMNPTGVPYRPVVLVETKKKNVFHVNELAAGGIRKVGTLRGDTLIIKRTNRDFFLGSSGFGVGINVMIGVRCRWIQFNFAGKTFKTSYIYLSRVGVPTLVGDDAQLVLPMSHWNVSLARDYELILLHQSRRLEEMQKR